jgi:two-component system, NtrC family, sensor kinase
MPSDPPLPRLRTRLLATVALTNLVGVLGLVAVVMVTEDVVQGWSRVALVVGAGTLVTFVWISVLRRALDRLVVRPLAETAAVARAIAAGDATRRVEAGTTAETDQLASSLNAMTEQLLDAHQLRTRVDKLATMGRLAAGISHEIGNPLGAIGTYVHLARERSAADMGTVSALDAIEREAGRIDRIVRSLLDYARPRRLTPLAIDVNETVSRVLTLLTDQGVMRRITVTRDLDAQAPGIFAESHELEQLLVNILLNAVDAMEGAGTLYVRTRQLRLRELTMARRRQNGSPDANPPHLPSQRTIAWLGRADRPSAVLQVIVADSGPGVPAADAERIFDPFYSTKATGKGTGLGLAIVANTIENLGGTIWVQRSREGGAAFVMLLPLLGPADPTDAPYLDETLATNGDGSRDPVMLIAT